MGTGGPSDPGDAPALYHMADCSDHGRHHHGRLALPPRSGPSVRELKTQRIYRRSGNDLSQRANRYCPPEDPEPGLDYRAGIAREHPALVVLFPRTGPGALRPVRRGPGSGCAGALARGRGGRLASPHRAGRGPARALAARCRRRVPDVCRCAVLPDRVPHGRLPDRAGLDGPPAGDRWRRDPMPWGLSRLELAFPSCSCSQWPAPFARSARG